MASTIERRLLILVSAVLETGTGLALLVLPRWLVRVLLGAELVGAGVATSRLCGVALVSLGLACWPPSEPALHWLDRRAVCALLVYNASATAYLGGLMALAGAGGTSCSCRRSSSTPSSRRSSPGWSWGSGGGRSKTPEAPAVRHDCRRGCREQGLGWGRLNFGARVTSKLRLMNLLVTGGAGFIGSSYVRLARRKRPNDLVVNVDALTYAGNLENLRDLETDRQHVFVRADIRESATIVELLRRHAIDAVVNFAAESPRRIAASLRRLPFWRPTSGAR